MSDFLSNLAARSLGAADLIRPRVPSLYEPYRRDSNLPGAPNLRYGETNPGQPDEAVSENDGPAAQTSRRATGLRSLETPLGEAGSAALVREPQAVNEIPRTELTPPRFTKLAREQAPAPAPEPRSPAIPPLAAHAPAALAITALPEETAPAAVPADIRERNTPEGMHPSTDSAVDDRFASPQPDLSVRRPRSGELALPLPEPPHSPASSPLSRIRPAQPPIVRRYQTAKTPRVASTPADGVGAVVAPPATAGRGRPEVAPSPVDAAFARRPALGDHRREDFPPARSPLGAVQPATPQTGSHTEVLEHRRRSAEPMSTLEIPKAVRHAPSVNGAVRPPVRPRSGTAKTPAAPPGASEPAIQVTIGRVEVRAVFPEPAARRIPPARPRPTVSLDDYLKRGSGGKR